MIKPPGIHDGGYAIEFSVFLGQQFFDGFAIPAYIGANIRVALLVPEVEQKMSKRLIERYFKLLKNDIEERVKAKFSSEISMIILPGK